MQLNYDAFIGRVIDHYEGGYGWDKGDPGGPTKYGITCYDLAEHRGKQMTSMEGWAPLVKAMTLQEAKDIYRVKYATKLYFDSLRSGADTCILDYGINSGIARPLLVAKRLLNFTGNSNLDLVTAINAAHSVDPKWFIDAMCQERLHFMHQIRGGSAWAQFGHGWGARVADVDAYSDSIASSTPAPLPPAPAASAPKVTHGDPNATTNTITKTVATGTGSGGLIHLAGFQHWTALAVVGGVALCGIAFAVYESRRVATANQKVVIPSTVPPIPPAVAQAVAAIGVPNVAKV